MAQTQTKQTPTSQKELEINGQKIWVYSYSDGAIRFQWQANTPMALENLEVQNSQCDALFVPAQSEHSQYSSGSGSSKGSFSS